ncbi:MAG: hypothetical protein KVP17_000638 [Porospora cf. gigantea B]|uniref:uncharacterized protein n=1 Tax=Porospora cf. gigantea B TaxID=2853592 RepID=UPI003571E88A|nr:MAG: hypothetical protein KVP17_000638 [Porospora cf. gigantea B]
MANIGGMCKTADCYEDPYFRSKVSCFVQGHDDLTTSTTTPTKITTTTPTTKETTTEIATTTPKTTTEIATTTPKTTTEETTTTPKTTTEETTTTPKTTKETTTTPKTTTEETTTTPEATTTSLPPPTTTTTTAQTHTEAAKDIGSGTVAIGGAVGAVTTFSIYTCCGGIDLLGVVDNGGEAADLLSSDNGAAGDGMRDFVRTSLLQRAASG